MSDERCGEALAQASVGATQYRIESLADFVSVPADRVQACLVDFAEWIAMRREDVEWGDFLDATFDVPPGSIKPTFDAFIWLDDGLVGIRRLHFSSVDGRELGEIDLLKLAQMNKNGPEGPSQDES